MNCVATNGLILLVLFVLINLASPGDMTGDQHSVRNRAEQTSGRE